MQLVDPDVLDDHLYWVEEDQPKPLRASLQWWTIDNRLETLRRGYAEGIPLQLIAQQLGCTQSKAAGKAYRLGLRHLNAPA